MFLEFFKILLAITIIFTMGGIAAWGVAYYLTNHRRMLELINHIDIKTGLKQGLTIVTDHQHRLSEFEIQAVDRFLKLELRRELGSIISITLRFYFLLFFVAGIALFVIVMFIFFYPP